MADRVGLAASVITIMGCVGITLRHLFIWGCLFFSREAEIDVKALQDLLDGTTLLLEEASRRRSTFPNPHLDINLVRAQRLVVQLKNILHQIRGSQNRSRVWRIMLWLRHGANVEKLQFRLQALKDEVSNMHSMSLTKETVKTLHSINHGGHREITMLQDVSSKFSRQVEDWRTDALSTQLVSYGPTIPYRGFLAESLTAGHRSHLAISTNSLQASSDRIHPTGEDDQATHSACAQPVSKFELSKTFKPTKYVGRNRMPPLFVASFYQEVCSYKACINRYRIYYFQSEERWMSCSISLEIPRTSAFWDLTQVTQRPRAMKTVADSFCLPASLIEGLRKCLENGRVHIEDGAHFSLRLTNEKVCFQDKTAAYQWKTNRSSSITTKKPDVVTAYNLFSWIRHTDCPRYPESQVHPQAVIETADSFASYLCGKLVLEVKTLEQAPSRDFCYNLQILNSLRHETRILQLVGVTTDDNRRRVKSYLVEWPITKCQRLLDRASSSDSPWGKIETWSRRLIRAIHAVHSRFFVVGTLRYPRPPIIVDAYDNIYLHRFKSEFRLSRSAAPFYPPEYRHYAQLYTGVPTDIDQPILTPAYDLYQLGQILWILAESWATGQSAMALKEWFYREPNTWRGGLYTGPDPLPLLSDKVPRYYQDVVNYCCAPDPSDRLPCKDLLRMFPPSNNDMEPEPSNLTAEPMSIQSMQDCRMDAVMCEFCRKLIDSRLYKCMICVNSDFDVCSQCFDTGMHCYDPDHLLVEATIGDEFPIKTRYHSSPNKLGVRTIVVDG